jgi:hypothetical protein
MRAVAVQKLFMESAAVPSWVVLAAEVAAVIQEAFISLHIPAATPLQQ